MLDGGSRKQIPHTTKEGKFSCGTIAEFYPMVCPTTWGDGDRPPRDFARAAADVEAGGHGGAVGIPPRGNGPQCIRVRAPLRLFNRKARKRL